MATTYLESDFTGTGSSSAAIATYSIWVKLDLLDNRATLISGMDDASNYFKIRFADDGAGWYLSIYGESPACHLKSSAVFRDPAAWYHVVIAFDTAQAVDTNRIKAWINGVQITSWSLATYLAQDDELFLTKSDDLTIGDFNSTEYFDGYMAEFVCIDGTAYDADDFGEFDEDSPTIWKPKKVSGLTFGTKGYYLDFGDSAALGDDVSGNSNDFTPVNIAAADQATDTPTNNFCVMNPLDNRQQAATFSEGNCKFQTTNGPLGYNTGTIGVSSGKWYFEAKVAAETTANAAQIGVSDNTGEEQYMQWSCYPYIGTSVNGYSYKGNGYYANDNSSVGTGFSTYTTSIISVYLDLDNYKIYWAKDNVMENSGTGRWGAALPAGTFLLPAAGDFTASYNVTMEMDFGGCPAFAISSGNTDVNGYGNFEYDPSRGGASDFDGSAKDFLAICTKNLGSDGG